MVSAIRIAQQKTGSRIRQGAKMARKPKTIPHPLERGFDFSRIMDFKLIPLSWQTLSHWGQTLTID